MFEQFARHLREQDRSEGTVAAYVTDLRIFSDWFREMNRCEMSAEQVTPIDVRDYKTWLQETRNYRPATVNRKLSALKVFFAWAVEKGIVASDPTSGVRWVRETRNAPRWLDRREQRDLMRQLEIACQMAETPVARFRAYRDRAMVALMMWGGLRRSEVANAKLADLTMNGRSARLEVRGKRNKTRVVMLNVDVFRALKNWLGMRGKNASQYLFLSQQGAGMTAKSVYRATCKYAQAARIEMSPHSLRHTFAKSLVDQDVSLEKVATLLGHENLNTTAIYLEPSEADLQRAVEKIAWSD